MSTNPLYRSRLATLTSNLTLQREYEKCLSGGSKTQTTAFTKEIEVLREENAKCASVEDRLKATTSALEAQRTEVQKQRHEFELQLSRAKSSAKKTLEVIAKNTELKNEFQQIQMLNTQLTTSNNAQLSTIDSLRK